MNRNYIKVDLNGNELELEENIAKDLVKQLIEKLFNNGNKLKFGDMLVEDLAKLGRFEVPDLEDDNE